MRTELVSALVVMSLFWLCLSNNLFVVSGLCHDDQRSLLLQLKNNLTFTFQRSTKLKSWNLTNDCCGWIGVSCDKKGHVTALDLSRETITGGIDDSSSLFSLQHLRILNLADNNLHSVIPSAFKRMENLTYLNLSYAGFVGQIPIEISQMIRLITLDLSCFPNFGLKLQNPDLRKLVQNLTSIRQLYLDGVTISAAGHEWSSVLMSLHDLQEVRMSDCDLSGPLDPSLSRHESLSVILLEGNNLSSAVPETFADFKFLTILSLFDCQLTGTFPQKIFNIGTLLAVDVAWNHNLQGFFPDFPLGSLHTLIVSNTRFSGAFPRSFGNMRNLSHLDFSYCQFNGTIPNSLSNLTELTFLVLSYNNFTGQIPSFNMANKLTVLDLSYNGLSGSIPSSYFEGLNNLVSIYLCFNSISGSIPSSLFTLPQLKTIMLSNNRFFQLDEFTNVSSSKLTNLDLSSNNISGPFPKSIYQLSGLVLLVLSSNKLNGTMHLNKPSEFRNLALLDLSYNNLSVEGNVTNDDTSYFPSIEDLQLVSCNLNRFPGFLRNHSEINYLDLSDNHIHGIIPNWIWKLPLAELDISHNLLTYSEGPLRNFSSNLNILDLHDNEIQGQIPFIPTDMEYLDFSRNTFRGGIPDSLCNASSLCLLDLSDNNISGTIPSCLLEMGRNLEVLNLRKNNVMGPVPGKISSDCSLMTLDLHQNKLDGKIPKSLSNCTSLQVLDLGQNKIRDVFPCLLKDISTLLVLVLRENNLYGHIGCPNTNATWPVLQILDLAINNFSGKLPQTVFTRWEATVSHENQPAYTCGTGTDFWPWNDFWSTLVLEAMEDMGSKFTNPSSAPHHQRLSLSASTSLPHNLPHAVTGARAPPPRILPRRRLRWPQLWPRTTSASLSLCKDEPPPQSSTRCHRRPSPAAANPSASATSNTMAHTPRPSLAAKERQAAASQVGMAAPAEMEGEKVAETSSGTGGDEGRESRGDGVILGCSTLLQFVFWFECRMIKHAGTFTILRAATVFPLLGFTPSLEPAYVYSSTSVPQLSNLPLEFRVPLLETQPALSPFPGETRARIGNFAQASRIRLGESGRGLPKLFSRKVAQATCSSFLASEPLAQARGVSPKRDPAVVPGSCFEPSPGRRGTRLSETFSPERGPSA
ncbi:LRR receptor-like serine/threonine-protein kinase FLS2 [Vigna unguiculata]|uniref:LRR receptor-like serine/threonine-protein kinase FLS2 n=1 Tax=Vigna unguiculata TaxID=3917 RepID=A0A4D6MPK8_VIGUN|nr:LRR receptor-like serine/threonine-protein kinase FLS2 [Vigna unguiculata]